jgi:hypothetical protein
MHKRCFKCGELKTLSAFYYHKKGERAQCKKCVKMVVRKYFLGRIYAHRKHLLDRIRARDRRRGQDPKRKAGVKQRYEREMATEKGRKRLSAQKIEWAKRNRRKRKVHILVGNAIRDKLIIPGPCKRCGAKKTTAHHKDYSKPFKITWLCRPCHGKRHRELNERQRQRNQA